jgi:hypothetical protein
VIVGVEVSVGVSVMVGVSLGGKAAEGPSSGLRAGVQVRLGSWGRVALGATGDAQAASRDRINE